MYCEDYTNEELNALLELKKKVGFKLAELRHGLNFVGLDRDVSLHVSFYLSDAEKANEKEVNEILTEREKRGLV